ncbi:DUF2939 domain-containing protein [uncultured Sphingomonas sp.]|uniref:DUF2939 domain-containing protein n=1 Tax=uncultured Sphingomonas sp. TaxID=158754 RepID=UPI002630889A|nr:DUF2939 domain-containing protein [uncultured Sphingomonas sp.]
MKRAVSVAAIVAAIAFAMAGIWLWKSPEWQIRQFSRDFNRGDRAALNARVDYPAVQADIERQVIAYGGDLERHGYITSEKLVDTVSKAHSFSAGMVNDGMFNGIIAQPNSGQDRPLPPLIRTSLTSGNVVVDGTTTLDFKLEGLTWKVVGMDITHGLYSNGPAGALEPRR